MRTPLESSVEAYLVQQVHAHGLTQRKLKFIGRRGAPDRLVLGRYRRKKVVWFVEVKRPGGVPRPDQVHEHNLLRYYDQDVFVVSSREEVDALFA